MPKFGRKSRERLETCHKDLQVLFNHVIENIDFCDAAIKFVDDINIPD